MFVLFPLTIALSVLRFTASDNIFGIFSIVWDFVVSSYPYIENEDN